MIFFIASGVFIFLTLLTLVVGIFYFNTSGNGRAKNIIMFLRIAFQALAITSLIIAIFFKI